MASSLSEVQRLINFRVKSLASGNYSNAANDLLPSSNSSSGTDFSKYLKH